MSVNSIAKYVDNTQQAWMITPVSNIASRMVDRESNRKYYFTDNGLLSLFLTNQDTALPENLVAIHLFRLYGRDERVFFFNREVEIDFYVPEAELAIQVCYSLVDADTRKKELGAFHHFPQKLPCTRRVVITYDEEENIVQDDAHIEVIPVWKWLLASI